MKAFKLIVTLFAVLFGIATSASTNEVMFSADVIVRVSNGQYGAKLYYLYNRTQQYLLLNYSYPINMLDLIDYTEGTRYKVCTSCESGYYVQAPPVLYKQATDNKTTVVENGCRKYIPADTSGATAVWFKDSDNSVCRAELTDGRTFEISNVKTFSNRNVFKLLGSTCPAPVCKRVMDIVFVVDNSGSVGQWNWLNPIKNFLTKMVESFDVGSDAIQVGLLTYASVSREVFKLSANKDYVLKMIKDAKYASGGTCTGCGIHSGLDALNYTETHRSALDPEKILIVITDGENWDKQQKGTPCADYEAVCTKYGTNCAKYKCDKDYVETDSSVCEQYVNDTTKCKRKKCTNCKDDKWGAVCLTQECTAYNQSKCVSRDTSYCELAYYDCSVKNGVIQQTKSIPCICSKYKCIEYACVKETCTEYSCDDCTGYGECVEYEQKCAKYAKKKTCPGTETCAEKECLAGTVRCKQYYNSVPAMIMGAIIRSRTQWVLYPATTRLPIVISIGVGRAFEKELMATASTLQGKTLMYKVDDFQSLLSILDDLVEETCLKQTDNLEFCSDDCKGFCGCGKKCYCPRCDSPEGSCYSINCVTDGKTTAGCTVKHNTCPNDNHCITLTPKNDTVGCCYREEVDCSKYNNACFNAKCSVKSGCYGEPIEPVPENSCFNASVCDPLTGWSFISACPFIDNCTINVCVNDSATMFTCTPTAKCNSSDKCVNDTCDLATGTCGKIHKVCEPSNDCYIAYCMGGTCYESVNDTLKRECKQKDDPDNCMRGYCNTNTGKCDVEDYSSQAICNVCKNYEDCSIYNTVCSTFDCAPDENNKPYCKETKVCTPTGNPCVVNTCNETTGTCSLEEVVCTPPPCSISECVADDTSDTGYVCKHTSLCPMSDACYTYSCDVDSNSCIKTSTCADIPCKKLDKCTINDDGAAECEYIDKDCSPKDNCSAAYCNETDGECVYVDATKELCGRKPCQITGCDAHDGCFYTPIVCDDDNNCTIDACVPLEDYSGSTYESSYESSSLDSNITSGTYEFFPATTSNYAYVCTYQPKCTTPNFCERASCSLSSGECSISSYGCEDENLTALDTCHMYKCDEENRKCKVVLFSEAFLDVCGECVKEYGNDPDLDLDKASRMCIAGMTMPSFAATIGGAAIAGIVIVAIIVAAAIAVSSALGTRELMRRAKKNADVGTNTNPLYEGKDNEGFNPTFIEEQ